LPCRASHQRLFAVDLFFRRTPIAGEQVLGHETGHAVNLTIALIVGRRERDLEASPPKRRRSRLQAFPNASGCAVSTLTRNSEPGE